MTSNIASFGMTPETKKKKFNKSTLISQYSNIVNKKYIKEEKKSTIFDEGSNNGDDGNQADSKYAPSENFGQHKDSFLGESHLKDSNEDIHSDHEKQLESNSSKEGLVTKEISSKLEEIQVNISSIEDKIAHMESKLVASNKDSKSSIDKWKSEIEAYINELHCEIDEHSRVNKAFQQDVYERFKTQRKITGDLSSKVTKIYKDVRKNCNDMRSEKEETIHLDV